VSRVWRQTTTYPSLFKFAQQIQRGSCAVHTIKLVVVSLLDKTIEDGDGVIEFTGLSGFGQTKCVLKSVVGTGICCAFDSERLENFSRRCLESQLFV